MPDRTGEVPGRRVRSDPRKRNTDYLNKQRDGEYVPDFFSFKNEMVIEGIETYAHALSLLILNVFPSVNVDDGLKELAEDSWEQGHISGHMKDLSATEEAAYYDLCEDAWCLIGQLRNEWAAVTQLDNPTFSDITPTTSTTHRFLDPTSFNTLLESFEKRNFIVPVWLVKLLKKFTGLHCKVMPEYSIYGTSIPSIDVVFGVRDGDLEDLETIRDSMFTHKGDALQHMNKFGIAYVKFTKELITEVTEITYQSSEWWTLTQFFGIRMYGTDTELVWSQEQSVGLYITDNDWSGWWMYLYKQQIDDYAKYSPIFGGHHATNNNYGGLFDYAACNASEGDCNVFYYAQNGATPDVIDPVNSVTHRIALMLLSPYVGDDDWVGDDFANMALANGGKLTANLLIMRNTLIANFRDPFNLWRTTKTVSMSILQSFLLRAIINLSDFK